MISDNRFDTGYLREGYISCTKIQGTPTYSIRHEKADFENTGMTFSDFLNKLYDLTPEEIEIVEGRNKL
ncbi:MAG: hypothetical protein MRK02_11460 [Candidatus Scalindua sp.]|nr:hypothetical protein [Candidatus Scalindua sp.]